MGGAVSCTSGDGIYRPQSGAATATAQPPQPRAIQTHDTDINSHPLHSRPSSASRSRKQLEPLKFSSLPIRPSSRVQTTTTAAAVATDNEKEESTTTTATTSSSSTPMRFGPKALPKLNTSTTKPHLDKTGHEHQRNDSGQSTSIADTCDIHVQSTRRSGQITPILHTPSLPFTSTPSSSLDPASTTDTTSKRDSSTSFDAGNFSLPFNGTGGVTIIPMTHHRPSQSSTRPASTQSISAHGDNSVTLPALPAVSRPSSRHSPLPAAMQRSISKPQLTSHQPHQQSHHHHGTLPLPGDVRLQHNRNSSAPILHLPMPLGAASNPMPITSGGIPTLPVLGQPNAIAMAHQYMHAHPQYTYAVGAPGGGLSVKSSHQLQPPQLMTNAPPAVTSPDYLSPVSVPMVHRSSIASRSMSPSSGSSPSKLIPVGPPPNAIAMSTALVYTEANPEYNDYKRLWSEENTKEIARRREQRNNPNYSRSLLTTPDRSACASPLLHGGGGAFSPTGGQLTMFPQTVISPLVMSAHASPVHGALSPEEPLSPFDVEDDGVPVGSGYLVGERTALALLVEDKQPSGVVSPVPGYRVMSLSPVPFDLLGGAAGPTQPQQRSRLKVSSGALSPSCSPAVMSPRRNSISSRSPNVISPTMTSASPPPPFRPPSSVGTLDDQPHYQQLLAQQQQLHTALALAQQLHHSRSQSGLPHHHSNPNLILTQPPTHASQAQLQSQQAHLPTNPFTIRSDATPEAQALLMQHTLLLQHHQQALQMQQQQHHQLQQQQHQRQQQFYTPSQLHT